MRKRPDIPSPLPVNFKMTLDERIRGIVIGVPSWARRMRLIEDLVDKAIETQAEMRRDGAPLDDRFARVEDDLAKINDLIDRHNRFYPIEANLPLDPKTGRVMDRGAQPWKPLPLLTREDLGWLPG